MVDLADGIRGRSTGQPDRTLKEAFMRFCNEFSERHPELTSVCEDLGGPKGQGAGRRLAGGAGTARGGGRRQSANDNPEPALP